MKQLSGIDASFLYMETPSQFGHVSSLSIYERPDDPAYHPYDAFRTTVEQRMNLLELFRRRLKEVPFELDHPYWINDPDFDLDFHIRHIAVPPPGDDQQVADLVGRIIGRPMDRSRPLWEVYVIEGLAGSFFGVLTKLHHATIDGASGAELLTMLLDSSPSGDELAPAGDHGWKPESVPSDLKILSRTMRNLAMRPQKMARLQLRALEDMGKRMRSQGISRFARQMRRGLRGRSVEERDRAPRLPQVAAPPTPFNKSITPHRRFAYRTSSLDDIKTIKNRLGATVNDVVMAVCAGGLRRYLIDHSALPEEPLVAMVPVSTRTGEEEDVWTNRVSGLLCSLPTNIDDPVKRVEAVHAAMVDAKEGFDAIPADLLTDFTEFQPPALATRAIRMATRMRIADRMNSPINLVISNVPGPREPLYLGGAQLHHYFPVSTITDGMGLNITVQSYLDRLDFGLVTCRELMPDVDDLVDFLVAEIGVLLDVTEVE